MVHHSSEVLAWAEEAALAAARDDGRSPSAEALAAAALVSAFAAPAFGCESWRKDATAEEETEGSSATRNCSFRGTGIRAQIAHVALLPCWLLVAGGCWGAGFFFAAFFPGPVSLTMTTCVRPGTMIDSGITYERKYCASCTASHLF